MIGRRVRDRAGRTYIVVGMSTNTFGTRYHCVPDDSPRDTLTINTFDLLVLSGEPDWRPIR